MQGNTCITWTLFLYDFIQSVIKEKISLLTSIINKNKYSIYCRYTIPADNVPNILWGILHWVRFTLFQDCIWSIFCFWFMFQKTELLVSHVFGGFMFVSFTYLLLYTGYMVGNNNVHVNLESIQWEPFCYLHCRFIPVSILHISILYCKHHSWCMVIYWHSFSSLRQN